MLQFPPTERVLVLQLADVLRFQNFLPLLLSAVYLVQVLLSFQMECTYLCKIIFFMAL
jgi:hypothetical protein